jgi:hypothetical protein
VAFDAVPQFAFTGGEDVDPKNDCVGFPDSFSKEERKIIYDILGNVKVPVRFKKTEEVYRSLGSRADFKIYDRVAHDPSPAVGDIIRFFETVVAKACPACGRRGGSN